jgi:hypothetical protein
VEKHPAACELRAKHSASEDNCRKFHEADDFVAKFLLFWSPQTVEVLRAHVSSITEGGGCIGCKLDVRLEHVIGWGEG